MATLSFRAVYGCDNSPCIASFVVEDEASSERFELTWTDTQMHQFCPECRDLTAVAKQVEEDREFWRRARFVGTPIRPEAINVN